MTAAPTDGHDNRLHNLETATLTRVMASAHPAPVTDCGTTPIGETLVLLETTISGNTTNNPGDRPEDRPEDRPWSET